MLRRSMPKSALIFAISLPESVLISAKIRINFCPSSGATSGSTDKGLRSKAIHELATRMQKIGRIMSDWPRGFEDLVNAERQYRPRSGSLLSSARSVEHISMRLFTELPEPPFAFLHRALVDAIGGQVVQTV